MADCDDIDNMDFLPEEMMGGGHGGSAGFPAATIEDVEDDGREFYAAKPSASSSSTSRTQHQQPLFEPVSSAPSEFYMQPLASSSSSSSSARPIPAQSAAQIKKEIKSWICVYPIYFDAARSKAQGRRVSSKLAYENPTVYHIAKALERLQFPGVVEGDKTHPADQFNPGRVRTVIKMDGRQLHMLVKNRSQLFAKLASLFPEVQADVDELLAARKREEEAHEAMMRREMERMGMGGMLGPPGAGGMPGMPDMSNLAGLLGGMGGMPGMMPGMGAPPAAAAPAPQSATAAKRAAGKKIKKTVVRK
ncbi:signal recognition particle subunit [Blastocladiella emersonii ATCC 22665]|nr:signal recognition particle subunit [Blastocladiella emersonii ATCC 22665]